jgi:hypothetical protein
MNEIEVSILEYLGTLENGVLVIISIMYSGQYFEGTFFYTDTDMIFTISEELEEQIGNIKKHPQYLDIIKKLLKMCVPHNEIYNSLDPVNFTKWVKGVIEMEGLETPMMIDESEIKPIPGA